MTPDPRSKQVAFRTQWRMQWIKEPWIGKLMMETITKGKQEEALQSYIDWIKERQDKYRRHLDRS